MVKEEQQNLMRRQITEVDDLIKPVHNIDFKPVSNNCTKKSFLAVTTNFFRAISLGFKIENKDDEWEYTEEPHVSRRKEILAKHPEIKKLMGHDPMIAWIVVAEVFIQMCMAILIQMYKPGWFVFSVLTYAVGATLNHSLGSAIHEIGHNLAFGHSWPKSNRLLSLVCNLPLGVPIAISYKKYHQEHHRWLGHEENDVDIPMRIEVKLFSRPLLRMVWLVLHPLIHGVRPFFKSPKPIQVWEMWNILAQIIFDILVIKFIGYWALGYMVIGTLIGLGPHPLAGHFISEHYLFADNQATHSYYGPLNPILFNVGYHVEHHDFPYIPHTKLHLVKKLAPEYYDHLPYHTSLCKVLWDFIWMADLGPQGRSVIYEDRSKPSLFAGYPDTLGVIPRSPSS